MGPTASTLLLPAAVTHAVWNLVAEGVRGDHVVVVWWYVLGSAVLLGEELRPAGVAGLLLVVAGVVVIAAPGRTPAGGARARGRTRRACCGAS